MEGEIARAMEGQKADYPDGIEECGTDALRLTLLQYLGQVSQHSAPWNSLLPLCVPLLEDAACVVAA